MEAKRSALQCAQKEKATAEDDKPQLPAKSETAESGSADPALTGSEPDRENAPVSAERDS